MSGHLEKISKGSWTIIIEIGRDPLTGKRKRIKRAFTGNKREAEKEMQRLQHELNSGMYIEPEKITFAEFLNRWLKDYAEPHLSPRTAHRYGEIINNHVIPALGNIPLSSLKPMHLQRFYTEQLKEGARKDGKVGSLSPQTVLHHHRLINCALRMAVKWQMVPRNVAEAVTPPRPSKTKMKFLDEDQVFSLLSMIKDYAANHYLSIYLAIATGMRRGEIYGLQWDDIDFKAKTITVRRNLQYTNDKGIFVKEPKTKSSIRTLPVSDQVVTELISHKRQQNEIRLQAGPNFDDQGFIFCSGDGSPVHPDTISKRLPILLRKHNLPPIRFHDLRHTHASLLLKQGVHPKVISQRLGHSSISITMDTYSHLLPGMQEDAVVKLDKLLQR